MARLQPTRTLNDIFFLKLFYLIFQIFLDLLKNLFKIRKEIYKCNLNNICI